MPSSRAGVRFELSDLRPEYRAQAEQQLAGGKAAPVAELPPQASPWGKAKPTKVGNITFPSITQARVFERVRDELLPGQRLMLDLRLPLPSLAPIVTRKPWCLRVDFVVWELRGTRWEIVRLVDAKPSKWKSRDWPRGKAAAESSYGVRVEEAER